LKGEQEFPEWLSHIRILAPWWNQKVYREYYEIGWHDPQGTTRVKSWQIHVVIAAEFRQKQATNKIPTENKEKIHTDPTPSMDAIWQRKTHDAGVINNDDDDCQRPKEIETGLPLSILKPRIEINLKRCCRFALHIKRESKGYESTGRPISTKHRR
jgi:hypothetical protein